MAEFHFLRPWWLLAYIPLLLLSWLMLKRAVSFQAWDEVCDRHLLPHLMQAKNYGKRHVSLGLLIVSAALMIFSLAGPTWSRLPLPTYQSLQPRVIVLDMTESMLAADLTPNRLTRAKFKLHDLFNRNHLGQFGMIVFTGEPFIVSPLTDDAQTIDALLTSLTPDIMPTDGYQLDSALKEAEKLIQQAGFQQGDILVITSKAPSSAAIQVAQSLARKDIQTSVLPIVKQLTDEALFKRLAAAGHGLFLPYQDSVSDLNQWVSFSDRSHQFRANIDYKLPVWRDEGRWFLIPALVCLLPVFRRGWLQRLAI